MDVNKLLKALDNKDNEDLFNYTTEKIREMNFKVLKELELPKDVLKEYWNKLKEYKYVDEITDLKYGAYIRWIPIINPDNLPLLKGAIFCEIKPNNDGVMIICKSLGYIQKYFQIKMDENLIFQKLKDQELILLSALDHLAK